MRIRGSVAIDLGTVNTLVWVAGRGLVLEEPSAIAIDSTTGSIAAIGTAADVLADKEPQDIRVIHPLRDGVIADLDATAEMLHGFLRKARPRRRAAAPARAGVRAKRRHLGGTPVGRRRARDAPPPVLRRVDRRAGRGRRRCGLRPQRRLWRVHRGRGRRDHRGRGRGGLAGGARAEPADGRQRDGRGDRERRAEQASA